MKIRLETAIALAEIGTVLLRGLRDDGVKELSDQDIQDLLVNSKQLREIRDRIRSEQEDGGS